MGSCVGSAKSVLDAVRMQLQLGRGAETPKGRDHHSRQRTHLEDEAAQAPDVRLGVVLVLGEDLGGHIQRCLQFVSLVRHILGHPDVIWTHANISAGERSSSHILAETKVSQLDKFVRQEHCGSAGSQNTLAALERCPDTRGKVKSYLTVLRL
jgi:hypothetical protein